MSRPNFRIIEGVTEDIDYESFKRDYMNPLISKKEIREKYGLNNQKYLRQGRRVYEDTGFKRTRKHKPIGEFTNITKLDNGKFRVYKHLNRKYVHCGNYDTVDEARRIRNYLALHDWSEDAIQDCLNGRI